MREQEPADGRRAPELRPGEQRPDSERAEMRIGFTVSCLAHGTILALLAFGLPNTSNPRATIEQVVPVSVVTAAEKPAAPKVEPPKPVPPRKPEPPKEEAKAEPPKPAPPPPPPPPPEPPQAKPEPPKVEPPKPEPPPPPPPKVVEPPKPEPKKPEPPKPPPKQVAKAEPPKAKEPPKKQEPPKDEFLSVLKTVEKLKQERRPEITPPTPKATQPPPPPQQTALAFGEQITASDLDAVRERIRPCWNPNFGGRNAQDLVVEVEVWANPDGSVLKAQPRANMRMSTDPFYQSAAAAAMRAVLNERCQPLPLPREKYEQWKFFVLVFDPKQMLGM